MKIKHSLLFIFFTLQIFAQNPEKAKIYYEQGNVAFRERKFERGFELMNKALEKDKNFAEAYYRMGTIYSDFLGEDDKAIPNYEKAVELKPDNPYFLNAYGILGKHELQFGNYEKAKPYFEKYIALKPPKENLVREANRMISICDYALKAMQSPLSFKPKALSKVVNRFQLQYFPVLSADQQTLVFTARQTNHIDSDENLYVSDKKDGEWTPPYPISKMINTANNEGTCSISADGRTLVFTCCQGRETYGSCDLYVSYKVGGEWSDPENMGPKINTMAWESQPSLSADGRRLFFASDRRGGLGKRDIWVSTIDEEGYWQTPINMGNTVNTPYDDLSPFVHANGKTLYFASNGHLGLGGYDLFSTEYNGNKWSQAKNLGYPINTFRDEVSLFVTADGKKAYYAFEEIQGRQRVSSLLYEFDVPEQIEIKYKSDFLKGTVYDGKTKQKIETKIELYDVEKDSLVAIMKSDKKTGEYLTILTQGSEYALYINKVGYLFKSMYFNYLDTSKHEDLVIDIYLTPLEKGAKEILNNLFYKTAEYKLDGKSTTELNKIIKFMNEYKTVILEISGHTDDVDTDQYNQQLSEKRAKSVYDYLIGHGIDLLRLKYVGYGEKSPTVPNTSDKNRALNRRIEFKVLQK